MLKYVNAIDNSGNAPIFGITNKETPHAMNATAELKNVYKATQCTDASDVQFAMSEVIRIARKYGWTPALRSRIVSLEKRNVKFSPAY